MKLDDITYGIKVGLLVNMRYPKLRLNAWYWICPKGMMVNIRPGRPDIVCV